MRPAPTPAAGGRPPTPPTTAAPRCFRTLHGSSGPNSRQEAARAEHSEPQPSPHKRSRPRGARGTNPRPAPQPWLLDSSKRLRSDPVAVAPMVRPVGPLPAGSMLCWGWGVPLAILSLQLPFVKGREGVLQGVFHSIAADLGLGWDWNASSRFKAPASLCIGEEGGARRSFLFEFDQGGPKNAPSHFKPMSSNGAPES